MQVCFHAALSSELMLHMKRCSFYNLPGQKNEALKMPVVSETAV